MRNIEDRSGRRASGTRSSVAVAVFLAAALLLAACGDDTDDVSSGDTTSSSGPSGESLDGLTFFSTGVTEDGADRPLVDDTEITIEFTSDLLVVGAGCNSMRGPYTIEGDRLVVGEMASTMMGCDEALMKQDEWVASFLSADPTWSLDGDTLELTSDSVTITLVEKVPEPDRSLVGPTWTAESLVDADAVTSLSAEPPTFSFSEDGTVAFYDGCNRGSGPYEVDGDQVTFGAVALTKMACLDEGAVAWQDAVLGLIDGSPVTFTIEGDLLSMRNAAGAGLDLRAG